MLCHEVILHEKFSIESVIEEEGKVKISQLFQMSFKELLKIFIRLSVFLADI